MGSRPGEVATLLEVQITQILRFTYIAINVWGHPPASFTFHTGGFHITHHVGGKFLIAIPPADFPLTGSLELDPEVIQKLAPVTTHQQTQFGYPAVTSHTSRVPGPLCVASHW